MAGSKKGERRGGRKKGTPNRATVQREELARAQIAESLAKAKKAGQADPKVALSELYKAIQIAEGMSGMVQPQVTRDEKTGVVSFKGGDAKLFGEWFDRWKDCITTLMKYQLPQIKAIDAPAPPPDPNKADGPRRKFSLRVFDGGRQVKPLQAPGDE